MKRVSELGRRLRSLATLHEAVGAMKSLSAHHFRGTRDAVPPARAYREGIERLLASSGASLGAGSGAAGLLVVGGELGLCGDFNARVVELAVERRAALGPGPTLCVGHRAAAMLVRRGIALDETHAAPAGVQGITEVLLHLAENLLARHVREDLATFDLVASRFAGVGNVHPVADRLLPLATRPSDGAARPRYVATDRYASAAVREWLYIVLHETLLASLASEHGARLLATQAAEGWIQKRAEHLRRRLASARRESSTQEVVEIAAGARARRRPDREPSTPVEPPGNRLSR